MASITFDSGKACLNGWWDFLPIYGTDADPNPPVPQNGWFKGKLLVPSVWTQSNAGIRQKGETYFRERNDFWKSNEDLRQCQFLFDSFGYPAEWSRTRQAWIRRQIDLAEPKPGKRYVILVEAVMPRADLFVNGRKVSTHMHPALPWEADITNLLQKGKNELAVLVLDHERGADGRPLVPTGNFFIQQHCGIWQDVWLLERDEVYLSDVTIQTSVRDSMLSVQWEITNASDAPCRVSLRPDVCLWKKGQAHEKAKPVLELPETTVVIAPHSVAKGKKSVSWKTPLLWQPESPNLYVLRTTLVEQSRTPAMYSERFGFRELWIEGPHLMLNGFPVHGFSDWGHKVTPYFLTENWIRQWYGMIRDANMNHARLHAFPHPPMNMDIADEMGILLTGETGLYGSGGTQGRDEPAFWEASADHLRRLVRRDKNHPSIILWSVENEMRWNQGKTRLMLDELPKLRHLCNELDSSRFAYHEGDSSLWNERQQPIISRHYDKVSSGVGWWDRSRPLHSGEMALYHYANANNTSNLAGDEAWKSLKASDSAAAQDCAWIIEGGRALGVCNFGPWNISCLENLRLERKKVRLKYRDYGAPGMKPLQVPPHTAEFAFWKAGKGYTPNHSFKIQAHAFRPLAVLDNNRRLEYYAGDAFRRKIAVVNDTASMVKAKLEIALLPKRGQTSPVFKLTKAVQVKRGLVQTVNISPKLPAKLAAGSYAYTARICDSKGKVLDSWKRSITIGSRKNQKLAMANTVAVFGDGSLSETLSRLGIRHTYVKAVGPSELNGAGILVLEKNTVLPGSTINNAVKVFAQNGGRVLVLEQENSIFPGISMEVKPLQTNWVRGYGHPVLQGFEDRNFAFWGDTPYSQPGTENAVAEYLYTKNNASNCTVLLDGDQGAFGTGGLRYATLIETREGQGRILACQLLITSRMREIPTAERLLISMLSYLDNPPAKEPGDLRLVSSRDLETGEVNEFLSQAAQGKTIVVDRPTKQTLRALGRKLRLKLEVVENKPEYQVVRTGSHPQLCGISNEDISGIEQWSYAPPKSKNVIVGDCWIKPEKKLLSLLATPTESCLKELCEFDGKTELLRAHVFSRFLYSEKPKEYVALGMVRHGKGRILINMFNPSQPRDRFAYFRSRLLDNLGAENPKTSLLAGECVVKSELSNGYPVFVNVMNRETDAELRKGLIESTAISVEHIGNEPIMGYSGWRQIKDDNGIFSAGDLDISKPVFFYFKVISRVPRKELSSNLGIPNPEQLTFLDMQGDGEVQVTINAEARPSMAFENGSATAADIPLEQGANHVLIEWKPASSRSGLTLRWRDINGRPETKLRFG